MKYIQLKFDTSKEKELIKRSLETLIIKMQDEFFVFPFCMFNKRYYRMLRSKRNAPFTGSVNSNSFEFEKLTRYGNLSSGSAASRVLGIKGEIIENDSRITIKVEFHSSRFELITMSIIAICCLTLFSTKGNYLFLAAPAIIVLDVIYTTLKYYLLIKKELKRRK